VALLALLTVAAAVVARPRKQDAVVAGLLVVLALVGVTVRDGAEAPLRLAGYAVDTARYVVGGPEGGTWPSVKASVGEQGRAGLERVAEETVGGLWLLILAGVGLGWLGWSAGRQSVVLLAPVLVAGLGVFAAERFLIFTAPVAALGFGHLVSQLWRRRRRLSLLGVLAPALAGVALITVFVGSVGRTAMPELSPAVVSGLELVSEATPPDSVVWTWWDNGYPVQYWARRATVADGQHHGWAPSVLQGLVLASPSERLAANLVQLCVARGIDGLETLQEGVGGDAARALALLKDALGVGPDAALGVLAAAGLRPARGLHTPEDWLGFLFPDPGRPTYLFLDRDMLDTAYWWYWFGTWDPAVGRGVHPSFEAFEGMRREAEVLVGTKGLQVELKRGTARTDAGLVVELAAVVEHTSAERAVRQSLRGIGGPVFEVWWPASFGALLGPGIEGSVFVDLFVRHRQPRHFRPVALSSPDFQLWEVLGDRPGDPAVPE
jgi:dolichyl-diphosphooligosaccharide--protein glycosyltransferase